MNKKQRKELKLEERSRPKYFGVTRERERERVRESNWSVSRNNSPHSARKIYIESVVVMCVCVCVCVWINVEHSNRKRLLKGLLR